MVKITIPPSWPHRHVIEIVAHWNCVSIEFEEDSSVQIPFLSDNKGKQVLDLIPISCELCRLSTTKGKQWAKISIGEGVAKDSAVIEQFLVISEQLFTTPQSVDAKLLVGQIHDHMKERLVLVNADITLADLLLCIAIHPIAQEVSPKEMVQFCNVFRWIDYVCHYVHTGLDPINLPITYYPLPQ